MKRRSFPGLTRREPPPSGLAQIRYGLFLRKLEADLFHIPLNAVPLLMPKPYLVTIHDMSTLLFASQLGYRNRLRHFYLRRGLIRADRVMAVSMATCRDVEAVLGIPASRMRVVYNAPDPIFHAPSASAMARVHGEESGDASNYPVNYPAEIQRVLDRYRIHYPFLLYVGRTNPQKNIPRLVEAFAVLRGEIQEHPVYRDLRLLIIGDEISRYPALRHAVIHSRVEDTVRFLGFVPIDTLRCFLSGRIGIRFPLALRRLRAAAAGSHGLRNARGLLERQFAAGSGGRRRGDRESGKCFRHRARHAGGAARSARRSLTGGARLRTGAAIQLGADRAAGAGCLRRDRIVQEAAALRPSASRLPLAPQPDDAGFHGIAELRGRQPERFPGRGTGPSRRP